MTQDFHRRANTLARHLLRCGREDETGSALIELAISLSVFGIPLFLGTIYAGVLLFDSIELANAAHAGALYGMQSSTYASDSTGITAATQAESPDLGAAIGVTPTVFFACSSAIDGARYSTQTDAASACTGSSHPLEFIQVTATYSATPFARIAGMQQTVNLTSTSVMEVEE